MTRIEDGKGKNGAVSVSLNQRLDVSSRTSPRTYYESRDEGLCFVSHVDDSGAANTEYTLYLQNTNTTKTVLIDKITIASAAASVYELEVVSGTAAGASAITPTNLNLSSSNTAAATCRGGAGGVTGLTTVATLFTLRTAAGQTATYLQGEQSLRIGQNDAIALQCIGTADASISIEFHYESE